MKRVIGFIEALVFERHHQTALRKVSRDLGECQTTCCSQAKKLQNLLD